MAEIGVAVRAHLPTRGALADSARLAEVVIIVVMQAVIAGAANLTRHPAKWEVVPDSSSIEDLLVAQLAKAMPKTRR